MGNEFVYDVTWKWTACPMLWNSHENPLPKTTDTENCNKSIALSSLTRKNILFHRLVTQVVHGMKKHQTCLKLNPELQCTYCVRETVISKCDLGHTWRRKIRSVRNAKKIYLFKHLVSNIKRLPAHTTEIFLSPWLT